MFVCIKIVMHINNTVSTIYETHAKHDMQSIDNYCRDYLEGKKLKELMKKRNKKSERKEQEDEGRRT